MDGSLGGGVLGGVVAPLASVYLAFLAMLRLYRRSGRDDRRDRHRAPARPLALLRHLLVTAAGGFGVFLGIVLVFSFVFADQERALREALGGGGFLAALAVVVLALAGWIEGSIASRGSR